VGLKPILRRLRILLDSCVSVVYFESHFPQISYKVGAVYPFGDEANSVISSKIKGIVMATLNINGQTMDIGEIDPSTPLLWVLRDELGLVGTKYGCGIAQCGACTVHLDGAPVRSCQIPVGNLSSQQITTIEGLAAADGTLTPVQEAWVELDVPQCGYCQAGQIMSATALLRSNANPSDADIDAAMSGNICRCATYTRIRQAIKNAAAKMNGTAFYDAAGAGETA